MLVTAPGVTLISEHRQSACGQFPQDAPDPGGDGVDAEPGGQLGEGSSLGRIGQHQRGPLGGAELAPGRVDLRPVAVDDPGGVGEGLAQQQGGSIEGPRRRMRTWDAGGAGVNP